MELFGGASQTAAPSTAQSPQEVFARVCVCGPARGGPRGMDSLWIRPRGGAPGSAASGCCELTLNSL